jgi:mycothiol synthase
VTTLNRGDLDDIEGGPEARYWVHSNWYWHQRSLDNPNILFRLVHLPEAETAVGLVAFGPAYADEALTQPIAGAYELIHLVIDHRYQRQGIGRVVAKAVLKMLAAQPDCERVLAAHHPDNLASADFFTRLGFRPTELRNYDGDPMLELSPGEIARFAPDDRPASPTYTQLQMVWPEHLLAAPPTVRLSPGYNLRAYQPGDEVRFYEVMALAGWPGWNDERLQPWIARILPEGWFMAVHQQSSLIAASAMALHSHSEQHPFGGELGWVAGDPAHAGRGLGMAVCAAVTARFIEAGYRHIHLYTEHWRLAAIKTYLKLGYVPFLYLPEMPERWQTLCAQLNWPFTPELWRS